MAARENGEKTKNTPKAETESQSAPEPAYSQTIENVENYTKNLKETENQASGSEMVNLSVRILRVKIKLCKKTF